MRKDAHRTSRRASDGTRKKGKAACRKPAVSKDDRVLVGGWWERRKSRPKADLKASVRVIQLRTVLDSEKVRRGCTDCGYKAHPAALDFDHVRGRKKISVSRARSLATALMEAAKCEIRCANCHRIATFNRVKRLPLPVVVASLYGPEEWDAEWQRGYRAGLERAAEQLDTLARDVRHLEKTAASVSRKKLYRQASRLVRSLSVSAPSQAHSAVLSGQVRAFSNPAAPPITTSPDSLPREQTALQEVDDSSNDDDIPF